MNVGKSGAGSGAGTATSALAFKSGATEEWYGDGKLTETFTTS